MAVYKFRITFEEYEEVSRDVEILSSQTFYDFHTAILKSIDFDTKHAASFFVSDDYWRKNTEITLREEDIEPGVKLMEKVKVSSCIERPNQRFIYIYDISVRWTFMIELIKLVPEDTRAEYPRCVKKNGQSPKQYRQVIDKSKEKKNTEEIIEDEEPEEEDLKSVGEEKLLFDEEEETGGGDLHDDTESAEEGEEGEEEAMEDDNYDEASSDED